MQVFFFSNFDYKFTYKSNLWLILLRLLTLNWLIPLHTMHVQLIRASFCCHCLICHLLHVNHIILKAAFLMPFQDTKGLTKQQSFSLEKDCFFVGYFKFFW